MTSSKVLRDTEVLGELIVNDLLLRPEPAKCRRANEHARRRRAQSGIIA